MNATIVKRTGIGIFILGLAVFLSSLFISNYRLTDTILEENIGDKAKVSMLNKELEGMIGKEYSSKRTFITALEGKIEELNARHKKEKKWDKVIYSVSDKVFGMTKQSVTGPARNNTGLLLALSLILGIAGALISFAPYMKKPAGIKNDNIYHNKMNSRGLIGIILGSFLITFYIVLYWFPAYIAEWALLLDPLSQMISGSGASQWFLYGFIYTLAILVMGIRFMFKYRHSKYQLFRTASVMFFQATFAFVLSHLLMLFNLPYMDLKNMWPLDYSFFFEYRLNEYIASGTIGYFMLGWGIALFALGVPVFTYFYGKRWYCSWICGCGGLAETAGDPFRQLSDKSLKAWKIERWMVHGVLVFAVVMTAGVLYSFFTDAKTLLGINTADMRSVYGFAIGSVFAGVVGTGFYPLMGNRVWCRFGCPLAAYLGLIQRFKSRFRITTNGGQCISCGNCSTYCEMGIDVKWYAQRGQNIIRSSCVGCGVCSAVCPRGVLNLENGPEKGRFKDDNPITYGNDGLRLNQDLIKDYAK